MSVEVQENRYSARVVRAADGWETVILDPEGRRVHRRVCATEREARTFASTVEQHIAWLSPERFRAYYGLRD